MYIHRITPIELIPFYPIVKEAIQSQVSKLEYRC